MNKKKKKQNGFTIVELVIVIAVIGILAAILIPTFSNLVKKAKQSADQQLVYHINEAVVANEVDNLAKGKNGTEATMYDTLQALENDYGFTIEKMTPRSGNDIIWDSTTNRFALVAKDGTVVYTDPNRPTADMTNKAQMWRITEAGETLGDGYSHYLTAGWSGEVPTVSTGLDVGDNDDITSVTYARTATTEVPTQTVDIRTNGGSLTINAATDSVNHYGYAEVLDIQAIAPSSYHENGTAGFARLKQGHFVVESEGIVNVLYVTGPKSGDTRVIVDNNNGIVGKAYATQTETANIYNGEAQEGQSGNVVLEKYDAVITETVVTAMNSTSIVEELNKTESSAIKTAIEAAVESSTFRGNGTEEDPYIISSTNELVKLSNKVAAGNNYEDKWFALAKDIDMKDVLWGVATDYETINCIGTAGTPFKGNFDGNGYIIKNLSNGDRATTATYTSPTSHTSGNYFALFGYVSGGTSENPLIIRNLTVDLDANIPDGAACAGLISTVSGTSYLNLTKVTVTGDLIAKEKSSGFIYDFPANSTITLSDCVNASNVSGKERISGFVGFPKSTSTIQYINCQNTGNITLLKEGAHYGKTTKYGVAAGFTSHLNSATITYDEKCSNSGTIDAPLAADFQTYAGVLIFNPSDETWTSTGAGSCLYDYAVMMKGIIRSDSSKAFATSFETAKNSPHCLDGIYYDSDNAYVVDVERRESSNYRFHDRYTLAEWNNSAVSKHGITGDDSGITTITLLSDLTWTQSYLVGTSRNLVIDLNGHTLTASSSILSGGGATRFTFKNGTIIAEGVTLVSGSYSDVNFENVTGSYIDQ